MLKILMYEYIRKRYSSRQIAEAAQCDIKFIWLAGGNKPTRNVIKSFRRPYEKWTVKTRLQYSRMKYNWKIWNIKKLMIDSK